MIMLGLVLVALSQQVPPGWEHVDVMGWEPRAVASGDQYLVLMQRGPSANLIWVRSEYPVGSGEAHLSSRVLVEVDCSTSRFRVVQGTTFSQPNMQGRAGTDTTPTNWTYSAPGAVNSLFIDYAC